MIKDGVKAIGSLSIRLLDDYGSIKTEININNLVVSIGKAHIASLLTTTPQTAMGWIAVGTGTTTQTVGDTLLQTEIGTRVACTKTASSNVVTYTSTFNPGVCTGSLTEAGIFNSATTNSGVMLAHTTFPVVNKTSGETIVITWSVTIS